MIDWSDAALAQLEAEAAYIAIDRPLAALAWADQVEQTIARLQEFSMSGRSLPDFPSST
jgi:plasmid stabilization system protein ParE